MRFFASQQNQAKETGKIEFLGTITGSNRGFFTSIMHNNGGE